MLFWIKAGRQKAPSGQAFREKQMVFQKPWVCVLLSGDVHCLAVRFLPWLLSVPALPWPVEVLFEAQKEPVWKAFGWLALNRLPRKGSLLLLCCSPISLPAVYIRFQKAPAELFFLVSVRFAFPVPPPVSFPGGTKRR